MKLNKLFKFMSILLLVMVMVVLSCQAPGSGSSSGNGSGSGNGGSDSEDNNQNEKELANGVYAKLIIARIATQGTGVKMDSLEAIFSEYYDPCAVISDLQPTSVSCSDTNGTNYDLIFTNNLYLYNDPMDIDGFLELGLEHEFDVVASIDVPALTESVVLPAEEPTIIAPADSAVIQKSNDLDVEWNGNTPGGNVVIVLISVADTNELISIETDDDGSHTFTAAEISLLSSGQYYLHVERFNEEFISSPGYDDRSIIRARILNSIFINLID